MRRSWSVRSAGLAGAAALGLGLVFTGSATAAPVSSSSAWTIQPSPDQPGAVASDLNSVSCVKGGSCAAVGTYFTGKGVPEHQFTLALERTGTKWLLKPTPAIKGVGYSLFNGVSCTAANSCIAVGYTVTSARQNPKVQTLAERWNGTSWAVQTMPPVPDAALAAVSCPAPAFCLAVGAFSKPAFTNEQPLAEEWNGRSWAQLTAPNPHAENGSSFTSVDCVAAGKCEATGDYDYADVAQSVFAYGLDGTSWTAQKQVNPAGQEFNSDAAVSCTSTSACTSAGAWTATGSLGLAERWNGTAWSRQKLPLPAKSVTDELLGVSCPAAALCTAVGDSSPNANDNPAAPMALTWNGTSWQVAATTDPAGGGGFRSVSCTAPGACVGVGVGGGNNTLVEVSPAG